MASLNFTDIAEVGSKGRDSGSFLVQVSGVGVTANAVVYSGILNEDVDGAPRCYGVFPTDAGLDRLRHATNLVGGGQFNALPDGQVAHPWMWTSVANLTVEEADHAGFSTASTRNPSWPAGSARVHRSTICSDPRRNSR